MGNPEKVMIPIFVIMGLMMGIILYQTAILSRTYHDYPIYKATLPFGVIRVEGNFILGTGSLGSEEYYYIKYFDGNKLASLTLSANHYPLIIDGTFRLTMNELGTNIQVHIPRLPEANQTWTTEWIK